MFPKKMLLVTGLSACFALAASAGPIVYDVTVNTSAINGTAGSLDFSFNPGPLVTQAASVQILNFGGNGSPSGSPIATGDVTGTLPAMLTFDNGTPFNDYFTGFTFGTALTLQVSLFGPALSSPDGVSTSGSAFAFSMFSDAAGTIPALTTDAANGFALTVNVNLDGSTTVTNFSQQLSVGGGPTGPVPEPASLGFVATALVFGLAATERGRRLRRKIG